MRILLKHLFDVEHQSVPLPLDVAPGDVDADAVLVIGDRAMRVRDGDYPYVLDLGYEWSRWTGLPFVWAFWSVRPGLELEADGDRRVRQGEGTRPTRRRRNSLGKKPPSWDFPRRNANTICNRSSATTSAKRRSRGSCGSANSPSKRDWRRKGCAVSSSIQAVLSKAVDGGRLTREEGLLLLEEGNLLELGRAADAVTRRLHPESYRTYNIDRNINYTNVCAAVCDFCAFYRKKRDADAYVLDRETLYAKIQELVDVGGDQILMQGGLHPDFKLEWYEELLRDLKAKFPTVNLHAFSPPEIWHFHKINKLPLRNRAAAIEGRRARQPSGRRRRDPRRPRSQGDHSRQVFDG